MKVPAKFDHNILRTVCLYAVNKTFWTTWHNQTTYVSNLRYKQFSFLCPVGINNCSRVTLTAVTLNSCHVSHVLTSLCNVCDVSLNIK